MALTNQNQSSPVASLHDRQLLVNTEQVGGQQAEVFTQHVPHHLLLVSSYPSAGHRQALIELF